MVSTTPMRTTPIIVSDFASARSSSAMLDYALGMGQQLKALAREHDRPLVALEQDDLELPLERCDAGRDRRLRNVEALGDGAEAPHRRKPDEGLEIGEPQPSPVLVGRVQGAW